MIIFRHLELEVQRVRNNSAGQGLNTDIFAYLVNLGCQAPPPPPHILAAKTKQSLIDTHIF